MIQKLDWKKITPKLWEILLLCISPFFMFLQVEFLQENKLYNIREPFYMVNYLWYAVILGLCILLIRRVRCGAVAAVIVSYIMGLANHYVLEFRGIPILPWDFKSVGTAMEVAGAYDFSFAKSTWIVTIATVAVLVLFWFVLPKEKIDLKKKGNLGILAAFLVFAGGVWYVHSSIGFLQLHNWTIFAWNQKVQYQCSGAMASFMENLRFMDVKEPEGYSAEKIRELAKQYKEPGAETAEAGVAEAETVEVEITGTETAEAEKTGKENMAATQGKPNIIAIMDESFADISMIKDLGEEAEYMPFFDSLTENTMRGNLNVSAFGGNTCNTEFEFLTSLSMAFVPSGSVPYQQYVDRDMASLATVLKEQGYSAAAIHPCKASNWNRDKVYPYLGFDEFISEKEFEADSRDYLRGYLSDRADFDRVMAEYEKRKDGEPFFLFNVTMQNHGGYTGNTPMYLDLIRKTDSELERLINYLKEQAEPTILVFFGDHQPNLQDGTYDKINQETDMSVYRNKYLVPFVIWANYEMDAEQTEKSVQMENLSPGFLAPVLLETAGLSMPPYYRLLLDKMQEVPAVSINGHIDKNGVWHEPLQNGKDEVTALYEQLQYNKLFDTRDYVKEMFQ